MDYDDRQSLPDEMDVLEHLRETAPPRLLEFLDQILIFLPEEFRYRLKQVIDSFPAEGDNMHRVFEMVRQQWRDIQSEQWVRIVVTGPSQTGKTSLLQLLRREKGSHTEPIFRVVETPGLEEFLGYGSALERPSELAEADLILLVLDARYDTSDLTEQILDRLRQTGAPVLVVLNKADLVADASEKVAVAKRRLRCPVFSTSVTDLRSVTRLLKAMVVANPKVLYPLAQSFPEFRQALCKGTITQAAFASGLVGAVPLPVSDLLPITAIQTAMILKIARAYGCRLNRQRARELIPMLLSGLLVREAGHRLRRRFPNQKGLISVMVGGSWTFLMGRLAVEYFDKANRFLTQGDIPESVHS